MNISAYHKQHLDELLDIIFSWDKAIRNLERKFNKNFRLTLNQCRVILYVSKNDYIELSQINSFLNIDKSTTTRLIRPLFVQGFIDKFYQFGDKRKMYLKISDEGKERVEIIKSEFDKVAYESLKQVPAGKRDFTFQTVRDLIEVI